jgi:hypothetical protein
VGRSEIIGKLTNLPSNNPLNGSKSWNPNHFTGTDYFKFEMKCAATNYVKN